MLRSPFVRFGVVAMLLAACSTDIPTTVTPSRPSPVHRSANVLADNGLGVNLITIQSNDPAYGAQVANMVANAGFTWVRLELDWADIEPAGPIDQWVTSGNDHLGQMWNTVQRVHEAGLKIFMTLKTSPGWAQDNSVPKHPHRPPSATNMHYWDRYVQKMIQLFGDKVHHWGVWNEPNSACHQFIEGQGCHFVVPNADWLPAYETLLTRTSQVLATHAPNDWLIGYDLAWGFPGQANLLRQSLNRMQGLSNLKAVSIHRYDPPNLNFHQANGTSTDGDNIAQLLDLLGTGGRYELWFTEWGNSGSPDARRDHIALFVQKFLTQKTNQNWTKIFYFDFGVTDHAIVDNWAAAGQQANASLIVPEPAYWAHKYLAETWAGAGVSVTPAVFEATTTTHPIQGSWASGNDQWLAAGSTQLPLAGVKVSLHPALRLAGPKICYRVHFSWVGWLPADPNGAWYCDNYDVGPISWPGSNFHDIQAIQIRLEGSPPLPHKNSGDYAYTRTRVCYQAYVTGIGHQSVKCNGEIAGTVGQVNRMRSLTVYLDGDIW